MAEEQGLSAENRATLGRLGLFITNWIDMPISPHAEIGRITHEMLGQIMDAARSEARALPADDNHKALVEALEQIGDADVTVCDVGRFGGPSNDQRMCWEGQTRLAAQSALATFLAERDAK